MANEPERPIEKLLRASAKKRRDDAGAPLELHPATRRLLQREAARKFAKARPETRSLAGVFGRLWPRFAWGMAIFAALGVTVYVLLPGAGRDKSEGALAKNQRMSEALPATAPLTEPLPAPATIAAPPAPTAEPNPADVFYADAAKSAPATPARRPATEPQPFGKDSIASQSIPGPGEKRPLATGSRLADHQKAAEKQFEASGGPLAHAPAGTVNGAYQRRLGFAGTAAPTVSLPTASAAPPAVAMTPAAASDVAADESAKLRNESSDHPALKFKSPAAVASANRPQSAPIATDGLSKTAAGALKEARGLAVAQRFVQVAPEAKAMKGLADKATPAHPVLASFELEQVGQEVRIIDGDGSIYRGYVEIANAAQRARAVKAEAPSTTRADRAPREVFEEEAAPSLDSDRLAPQTYSFRVTGTNRSLNKKVVFTGNLLAATNLTLPLTTATNLSLSGGLSRRQTTPAQQALPPLRNSRISGKVVIGSAKAVEINALPANP